MSTDLPKESLIERLLQKAEQRANAVRQRPNSSSSFDSRPISEFDESLYRLGQQWRTHPDRPTPSQESLDYWSNLIGEWVKDPTMPLLIRKGGNLGIQFAHETNRIYTQADNSPAQWSFCGAFHGHRPTLDDIRAQFSQGELPTSQVRKAVIRKMIESGQALPLGGMLNQCVYGDTNRFHDGTANKLCHIVAIGLNTRTEVGRIEVTTLQRHMRQFLDPKNMFVIPKAYSGLGECPAFLEGFLNGES